jgi:hypothetical protein
MSACCDTKGVVFGQFPPFLRHFSQNISLAFGIGLFGHPVAFYCKQAILS